MTFDAPWDRTLRILTAAVLALMMVVVLMPPYDVRWVFVLKSLPAIVISVLCWVLAPTGYRLEGATLYVERRAGPVAIPLEALKSVRALNPKDLRGAIRTFGVGGFFGYYGKFWNSALGSHTWYVTDRSKAVLIETQERKYIVSPSDQNALIAAIQPYAR